ncbi:DUF5677 domain-containing protein [Streptomyces sp. NPDC057284]|uniref:DUF5677 domain-containing protein n=1 Tax=Streptomyces sp. NPDC057284 TaxID=3346083 RepID=UPI003645350F
MDLESSALLKFALDAVNSAIARGEFTAQDDEQVSNALLQAMTQAIEQSRELTPGNHERFRRSIEKRKPIRQRSMAKVRRSNLRRWGRGLRYYTNCLATAEAMNKMLEDCIREWVRGDSTVMQKERLLGVKNTMGGRPLKCLTMLALQSRACSIGNEIFLLAEHGFSEAVKARTRSLHELMVIADSLSVRGEGDTVVSDRYGAWTVAEARKELRALSALGVTTEPLSGQDAELEKRAEAAWGTDFFKQNGWAAPLFPGRRPPIPFSDIEKLVGRDHRRGYYLAGNDAIHAGPSALTSRARFRDGAIFPTINEVHHETTRTFLAVAAITLSDVCIAACKAIASITEDFDVLFAIKTMKDAVEMARAEFESGGMRA